MPLEKVEHQRQHTQDDAEHDRKYRQYIETLSDTLNSDDKEGKADDGNYCQDNEAYNHYLQARKSPLPLHMFCAPLVSEFARRDQFRLPCWIRCSAALSDRNQNDHDHDKGRWR